ncbi:hypothetical protein D3C71_1465580 [compost metagenome]
MNQEMEWSKLPLIKVTDKDRELARMILSGTPYDEAHKMTRGFLFHNVIEGEFIMASQYDNFMNLLKAYLFMTWPNVTDWDNQIEGKTITDLEWDPHLQAYKLHTLGLKRLEKVAQS